MDVGVGPPAKPDEMTEEEDFLLRELLALVQKCMPADKNSEFASFLPGFTSLRLLLSQQNRSSREEDLLKSILLVYSSYKKGGERTEANIAVLTARDFMLLSKHEKVAPTLQPSERSIPPYEGFENRCMNRVPATANECCAQPREVHLNVPQYHLLYNKCNLSGDMSSHGQDYSGLTLGVSPALHPIVGSPALDSNVQYTSLANSPTLQPISSQDGPPSELAPLGMPASPISDMLRHEGTIYREM